MECFLLSASLLTRSFSLLPAKPVVNFDTTTQTQKELQKQLFSGLLLLPIYDILITASKSFEIAGIPLRLSDIQTN